MAAKKPNILILWGDDIGYWNISAYNLGQMGYRTPNIDRIAKEGALFTDWYGQQSCTAGRACFITGQSGFRTGMLKVGLPGAKEGLQARDVTIAELLKDQGYMTAQFGKNHLGDADETLPTAHGFDEFFGSLYHLNAEEEFENDDYFKDPALIEKYKTRGVIHCWANPDGTQKIENTGPLGKKRMETIDEEVTDATLDYLEKAKKADKPFFLWWNSTRMHINTHLKKESVARRGSASIRMAWSNTTATLARSSTSSRSSAWTTTPSSCTRPTTAPRCFTWPDGGTTPFRGEKNENWEGGYRVPCVMRWPGVIEPGTYQQRPLLARRHAAHAAGGCRRAGCEGAVARRHEGWQEDVQGPPGRLQHHRPADGERAEPAQRVLLLERRRLAGGAAVRQLEGRVPGAAQRRLRRLAGSVHSTAPAQDHQPPVRSVRACRNDSDRLRPVEDRPYLPARASAGVRRRRTSLRSRTSRRARRSAASRSIRCWRSSRRRAPAEGNRRPSDWHDRTLDGRQPESAAGPLDDVATTSKTSTNGTHIRGRPTISTTIDGAGRTRTGAAQTSICCGRTSRTRNSAPSSWPAAEHLRRRSMPPAVPRPGSSGSMSARRACGTRKISSASTTCVISRSINCRSIVSAIWS